MARTNPTSIWARKMSIKEQVEVTGRMMTFAKKYGKSYLLAGLCNATSVIVAVIMPKLVQIFIDQEVTSKALTWQKMSLFILLYGGLLLLQAVSNYFAFYIFSVATEKTVKDIRNTIFAHIHSLGLSFFDQTPAGSIISRVTNDTESLKSFWQVFYSLFEGLVTVLFVLGGMFLVNPAMAVYFIAYIPVMLAIIWFYQSYSSRIYRLMRENLSRLNTKINESIQGISVIQHFHQADRIRAEFKDLNDQHYKNRRSIISMNALSLQSSIGLLEGISLAMVVYVLGHQYFEGMVEIGVIYAFIQYSSQFFRPMAMMMDSLSLLQDGTVASYRILSYLDNQNLAPQQMSDPLAKIDHARLEVSHLTFSYNDKHPVLKDISFTVEPGQTLAIVGHTGSGKSSIINVLMRFYEFQEGEIRIDGHSIRDFDYDYYRSQIGLVLQDSFLFYGDVARNIKLLSPDLSNQDMVEAARFVHADQFIEKDPLAYQAQVIEGGAAYSSGEKQLISFARTMARQPKLLILDEATAHIDSETEARIQESLRQMRKNRTTIAIAHRLSTIKDADHILVLDQGEVIEAGSHEQLIEAKGVYYQMYQVQTQSHSQ